MGTGQAPVLNYNIPQSACFNTYGHQFVKGVSQEVFLPQTKVAPPQNYFEVVQQTPEPVLRQRFAETVQLQRTDDVLIPNSAILRKHISLADSNLKAVALAATPVTGEVQAQATNDGEPVVAQQAFIFDKVNAINEVQLAALQKRVCDP